MGKKSVRVGSNRDRKLRELFELLGVKSDYDNKFSEAMREFIDELYHKLIINKSSQPAETPESEQLKVNEELRCINRIIHNKEFWCVDRPPA